MGAAMAERQYVVHLLSGGYAAFHLTPLAQRVDADIAVPYSLPGSAVAFAHGRVTVVLFIAPGLLFPMLLTEPSIRQLRTAGVGAGALRFVGQGDHLSFGHKEGHLPSPADALQLLTCL